MQSLQVISDALDQANSALSVEMDEIAAALASGAVDPAEVEAMAQRVMDLKDRISSIIP